MLRQVLALFFVLFLSAQAKFYAVDKDMQIKEVPSSVADFVKNDPNINAFVEFRDDREATGWVYYYYKASSANPDWLQQYLAGYMEGYSAYYLMWDAWNNCQIWFGDMNDDVTNFMHSQLDWIEEMIANNPQDNYWLAVNSTLAQMHGLYDGYQTGISAAHLYDKNLTFNQFYQITYMADLFDVMSKFSNGKSVKPLSCSFLARMYEDNLFVSHTTWFGFTSLLRAYRVLDLSLQNPLVKTKRMSYSGLPGALPSQDDFYILDNARVVTETSLGSNNPDVFSFIHSNTVPYWIRITVANLLFETQQDWVDIFFSYRSGTYNNQWMIIDFNNFNASVGNLAAAKNIIWMVEEFYGYTSVQDVTQELLIPQGYVASYNVPYSPAIQNVSQNPTNYTTDPRAILFKKYAPGVQNIDDFRNVMRMNNYSDTGDYCQAIASRCDLSSNTSFPSGAIDCKVTSNILSPTQQAWIQSGPTHETLPPFSWVDWPQYNQSRAGMPDVYDFDWVYMDPNTNYSTTAYEHGKLAMDGGSAFIMESSWRHQVGVSIAI